MTSVTGAPKDGLLTKEQLKTFNEEGYLIIPKYFSKEELEPVISSINKLVDDLASALYDAGLIKSKYENEGFYTRLTCIEKEYPGASVVLHSDGVLTPEIAKLWTTPRLLDMVQQLIGPNIAGHQVWNLRTKTPQNSEATVPWHQDTAYLNSGCETTLQPTAWIPLIDATAENGCMQVIAKGHKTGEVLKHECCVRDTWYIGIEEKEMEKMKDQEIVTCPVPMGGILLINQLIPHRSLENSSNKIRWSVDLRWQDPSKYDGFWGEKKTVLFRKDGKDIENIDWGTFSDISRTKQQMETLMKMGKVSKEDLTKKFNPIISGPWMARWPVTNHNKHSKGFAGDGISGWHKKSVSA